MIKNKINDTRVNSKKQRKKNLKDLRISPSEVRECPIKDFMRYLSEAHKILC